MSKAIGALGLLIVVTFVWLLFGLQSDDTPLEATTVALPEVSSAVALSTAGASVTQAVGSDVAESKRMPVSPADKSTEFKVFSDWLERYQLADAGEQAAMLDEGLELAQQRQPLMQRLIRTSPREALSLAVSYAQYAQLPASIRALTEAPFTQRADLVVLPQEDITATDTVTSLLYLPEDPLSPVELSVYGNRQTLTSKQGLPIQGIRLGDEAVAYDAPLQRINGADIRWAEGNLDRLESQQYHDFLTGEAILGSPVVAVAGGRVFYFSSAENLDRLNQQLLALEKLSGPKTGSQLLFLEFAANADSGTAGFNLKLATTMAQAMASSWTESPKKVLFIRADFSDLPGETISQSDLLTQLNGTVSGRIRDYSYGKTWIDAGVSELVIRLPQPSSFYGPNAQGDGNISQLYDDAVAAFNVQASGVDLNGYDIVGVQFAGIGFSWSGMASIGGSRHWLQGVPSTATIVHEFGHNYGLWHASFWDAGDSFSVGPGSSDEYGDSFDVMGREYTGDGHFHMQAKSRLNWLEPTQWQSVTSSGTYRINRFDHVQGAGVQALRIPLGPDEYYWLGYRRNIVDNAWLQNGVYLLWQRAGETKSWLVDSTPGSANGREDASVFMGQTYIDPESGIYITPTQSGGEGADAWIEVQVNMGDFSSNQAPVASIIAPTALQARTAYAFSADAQDPDGDPLSYSWDFGDGVFTPNSDSVIKIWPAGGVGAGGHRL